MEVGRERERESNLGRQMADRNLLLRDIWVEEASMEVPVSSKCGRWDVGGGTNNTSFKSLVHICWYREVFVVVSLKEPSNLLMTAQWNSQ